MEKRITAPRQVLEELQADYSICTKCKICQGVHVQFCEDSRFWRNCPSGTRFRWEAYYASGKMELARGLHTKEIEPNESMRGILYSCNLCSSCQEQCYEVKQILPTKVFELMRERAVAEGWGPMPEHLKLGESLEKNDNPWDLPKEKRGDWAKGLPLKDLSKGERAEVLFFAGCTYAADPNLLKAVRASAMALVEGGMDVGTLGAEELCCGAPMLLVGDRDFFETYAFENIERFKALGVKTIVAPCSHCAWVFKEEYADQLGGIEVLQISEALWRLAKKDKTLKPATEVKMKVAYHDPCKLGRRFDQYKKPRSVIKAIPGIELVEFPRATFNALCCGGGGGVPYAFPDFALWTAKERLFEAESTGAEAIVTSCPYCVQMFRKAIEAKGSSMKVYDLAELVMLGLGKEV